MVYPILLPMWLVGCYCDNCSWVVVVIVVGGVPTTLILLQCKGEAYRDTKSGPEYTTSTKKRTDFCNSIAIEMGGVSRHFSKVSGSGVNVTFLMLFWQWLLFCCSCDPCKRSWGAFEPLHSEGRSRPSKRHKWWLWSDSLQEAKRWTGQKFGPLLTRTVKIAITNSVCHLRIAIPCCHSQQLSRELNTQLLLEAALQTMNLHWLNSKIGAHKANLAPAPCELLKPHWTSKLAELSNKTFKYAHQNKQKTNQPKPIVCPFFALFYQSLNTWGLSNVELRLWQGQSPTPDWSSHR